MEQQQSYLVLLYYVCTSINMLLCMFIYRLVCAMLHWRAENSSLLLETEVDALSQDEDGFTPLV